MRILLVSAWFPFPPANGSRQRVFNLLRQLGARHEVTLLSFNDQPGTGAVPAALQALCARVEEVPWQPFDPQGAPHYRGLLSPTPRSLRATFSDEMVQRIRALLAQSRFDAVVASQLTAAAYAPYWQGIPAVFEEVELATLYERFAHARSLAGRGRHWLTWCKLRRYLRQLLRRFRACTVVSAPERHLLAAAVPGYQPIEIIPNGVVLSDYDKVPKHPEPSTLVFAGSFAYAPNYDAMCWFVANVLPRIRARVPGVRLTITGDPAGRSLPPADGVTQTGYVADVRPLVASAWVSLAPLREGAGTRVKILEAMALGTPVVATAKGAEGLAAADGTHLLLADDPARFAGCVVRLLGDADLRSQLAGNARRLVATDYDWGAIGTRLEALIERVTGMSG